MVTRALTGNYPAAPRARARARDGEPAPENETRREWFDGRNRRISEGKPKGPEVKQRPYKSAPKKKRKR